MIKTKSSSTAVLATNGNGYHVNQKTKTVKRVFNAMSELKNIKNQLQKSSKQSYEGYLQYLRTELPGEPIKMDKNTFTIKGYKFLFNEEGITCRDLFAFGQPVEFKKLPTPREVRDFLINKNPLRTFSSSEMSAAVELGKKLLEEKKTVPIETLAKIHSTESLIKAQEKALRLIKRIRTKKADSKRLIDEIPSMIPFKPLNIAIGIAIKYYREGNLRWAKFVDKIEKLITDETFIKRIAPPEKFIGLENMQYKSVSCIDYNKPVPTINVDGYEKEAGDWLLRFLLQKEKFPELHAGIMLWLKEKITSGDFIAAPFVKDKFIGCDVKRFKGLTAAQVEVILDVFYTVEECIPTDMLYADGAVNIKKGQKIRFYYPEIAECNEGRVCSIEKGIWAAMPDGTWPLFKNQKYKVI